jgi:hypothetical protein
MVFEDHICSSFLQVMESADGPPLSNNDINSTAIIPSPRIDRGEGGERGEGEDRGEERAGERVGGGGEWSVSFEQFIASVLTESALVDHFSVPLDIKVPFVLPSYGAPSRDGR